MILVLRDALNEIGRQDETRIAAARPADVGGATLGVDRHHPNAIGGIGQPPVAAESLEVVHVICFTQITGGRLPVTAADG